MLESIKELWYLYAFLIVLIIAALFVFKKAIQATAKRNKRVSEMMAKAKHEKELRDAYGTLNIEIIKNAPADTLFEGTALCLEAKCQKEENTVRFYDSLSEEQKKVYAFYYLASDVKATKLSDFFAQSSKPLTTDALDAAKAILSSEAYNIVKEIFDRYDEDNESASVIAEEIDELDKAFSQATETDNLFALGGEYIKNNADGFITIQQ